MSHVDDHSLSGAEYPHSEQVVQRAGDMSYPHDGQYTRRGRFNDARHSDILAIVVQNMDTVKRAKSAKSIWLSGYVPRVTKYAARAIRPDTARLNACVCAGTLSGNMTIDVIRVQGQKRTVQAATAAIRVVGWAQ